MTTNQQLTKEYYNREIKCINAYNQAYARSLAAGLDPVGCRVNGMQAYEAAQREEPSCQADT